MKSFRLRNVKAFVDSGEVEIKPITVFVGRNSCGKSSLLRFPAVLGQTLMARTLSPLVFFGQFVDYGNFDSVKHKSIEKDNHDVTFEVSYSLKTETLVEEYLENMLEEEEISFVKKFFPDVFVGKLEVVIDKPETQIQVKRMRAFVDEEEIVSFTREKDENQYLYELKQNVTADGLVESYVGLMIEAIDYEYFIPYFNQNVAKDIYRSICKIENPEHEEYQIDSMVKSFCLQSNIASEIVRMIYDSMYSDALCMSYIGPFREEPRRIYRDTETDVRDVGAKGENLSTILLRESEKN